MAGITLDEVILDAGTSSIAISDGTDTLAINGDGSINATVTAADLDIRDLTHVSDSVKVGDGTDFLAINADGSINVAQASASSFLVTQKTVPATASGTQLLVSALAGRRAITIQNLGAQDMYISDGTGTTTSDLKIPKHTSITKDWGPGIDVYGITPSATTDVRIEEEA